jgi:tRNA G10  N-methylase Trm11
MKTHIHLEMSHPQALPVAFQDDDVRYPESLVEYFLQEFTQAGDTVLDPFAGYGTTLFVAERMGRIPFGIELNAEKVCYVRSRLARPKNLIQGDSRSLAAIDLPAIDFSMTSPPYMNKDDLEDPFTDYQIQSQGYSTYLRDIRSIYEQLRTHMKPRGTVILEIANLKNGGQVTTLAWDVAQEISKVLHFEGEVVVCWDKYGYGYDHSYCLVYSVHRPLAANEI